MAGRGSTGRLLGLGFLFGGQDDGAVETAENVSEGMDQLADATERASGTTDGLIKFGNAIAGLNFLQLDRIGSAMEGLAEKAGVGPGGAANQIESFGVQFGKTFREATAGLGKYTAGVEKYKSAIGGVAFDLEVDAGELTRTTAAFVKQGHAVEDYGLSVRSMAGSMQAGILSGDQLAHILTALSEGYDMGAQGAGRHLDKITAIGEQWGLGKEAAQGLEAAIQAANPVLAKFGNLKVDEVTESIIRLAAAATDRLGGTFQDNLQMATGLFTSLSESREQMGKLITGLGSDFPDLAKEIGIATGDINTSMETVMKDPLTFARHIQKLMSTMDPADIKFQRLNLVLGQMPENFQFLVKGGEESARVLEEAVKPVGKFEGAFSRMAKKSSGAARTFQEQMDLLRDRHEMALNRMTSQTDSQVVRRQRKAYQRLGKTIDDLRKGPMGGFFQMALDIRRHGFIHGIIPAVDKLATGGGPLSGLAKRLQAAMPFFQGFGDVMVAGALAAGKVAIVLSLVSGPFGKFFGLVKTIFSPLKMLVTRAFAPLTAQLGKRGAIWMFLKGMPRLIPGLGALVTVGMLVYQHWDKFRLVAIEVWNAITDIVATVSEDLGPTFDDLGEFGKEAWQIITDGAKVLWNDVLKPLGAWVRKNLPDAFGYFTTFAISGIYSIVAGAKLIGKALDAAIGVGIAGFRLLVTYSPIGFMLQAFQKLAEWAGKTDLGRTLGLDEFAEGLKPVTDWITGGSVQDLSRELERAKGVLGGATDRFFSDIAKGNEKAAAAGFRVRQGIAAIQAGGGAQPEEAPAEEPPAKPRRVRRRTRARAQADRMAAALPSAAEHRYMTAGGTDLSQFFKGVERAVASGAASGTEKGVRQGAKRSPRPAEAGGAER